MGLEELLVKIWRLLRHAAKLWRRPALVGACNMTGSLDQRIIDVSSVAICDLAERGMCLIIGPKYIECDTDELGHP